MSEINYIEEMHKLNEHNFKKMFDRDSLYSGSFEGWEIKHYGELTKNGFYTHIFYLLYMFDLSQLGNDTVKRLLKFDINNPIHYSSIIHEIKEFDSSNSSKIIKYGITSNLDERMRYYYGGDSRLPTYFPILLEYSPPVDNPIYVIFAEHFLHSVFKMIRFVGAEFLNISMVEEDFKFYDLDSSQWCSMNEYFKIRGHNFSGSEYGLLMDNILQSIRESIDIFYKEDHQSREYRPFINTMLDKNNIKLINIFSGAKYEDMGSDSFDDDRL